MLVKVCFKCQQIKSSEDFYRHRQMTDGRLGKCKECTKADVRERYSVTREERRAYDVTRNQRPERRAMVREYMRKRKERHPLKFSAWNSVNNSIRDGKLERQPCLECGAAKAQAHHNDYSKPLDVEWLCFKCHRELRHGQKVTATP